MLILAVATSSPRGSLALSSGEHISWDKKAMHSELATVKLLELLGPRPLTAITHIAVVNGPGSFTGIRVGVNLARTLAYALNRPALAFNTLHVLAHKHLSEGEERVVAIAAVREHRYAGRYRKVGGRTLELESPTSQTEVELNARGSALTLENDLNAPDLLAVLNSTNAQFCTWRDLHPLYVRGSEAEEKMRQGLLKPV